MALPLYLAVTGEDFSSCISASRKIAWMACQFSRTGTGLSGIPPELPAGSMVILNDAAPLQAHSGEYIISQLQALVSREHYSGILLDFQRPYNEKTRQLTEKITQTLPCPVGVPPGYAKGLNCPVFLPPVPLNKTPQSYFSPWKGREIWLDVALDGLQITVTPKGSQFSPLTYQPEDKFVFADTRLYCNYSTAVAENHVCFKLCRTEKTLNNLLAAAEKQGVSRCIGLYRELYKTSL